MSKYQLDNDLADHFMNLESKYQLPAGLLKSVAYTESRYNPAATSPVGAQGMFQFMPATAKQYNVDVSDPYSSADGAAKYYSTLLKMNNGDLDKALAGYNWGQGNVQKKGLENAPTETKNYISQIKNLMGGNAPLEKKNDLSSFSPELLAAFDELHTLKTQGSQASLQANKPADPTSQFSPEQLAAFDEIRAQQQAPAPQQAPAIPPQSALTPQGGLPPVNPIAQVQGNPQSPQNVLSTQAQGIAFNQQQPDAIGQQLYQKMTAISDPNAIADFYRTLPEAQKLFVNKVLQNEGAKNPDLHNGFLTNLGQGIARAGQGITDSFGQMGQGIKSFVTGDDTGLKDKNLEIARHNALNQIYDTVSPSNVRKGGEIAGQIASAFVVPEEKLLQGGSSLLGRVAGSKATDLALKGGLTSIATAPVVNESNPDATNVLQGKLAQGAVGAVIAPVAAAGLSKIGSYVSKPLTAKLTQADIDAQAAAQAGGYKLLASELPSAKAQPTLIKEGQNLARDNETVKDVVTANQAKATQDIQDIANQASTFDKNTYLQKTGLDKIAQDSSHQYNYAAKQIENKINNVDPTDFNSILKVASEANYLKNKVASNLDYDEAAKLAPVGKIIDLTNSQKVLDAAKAIDANLSTPSLKAQFAPVLNNIETALGNGKVDYVKADKMFQEFGTLARQAVKTGDDNAARIYGDLKKAINTDKDAFVNSLPNDPGLQAYKAAYTKAKMNNMNTVQNVKNDNQLRNLMEPFNRNGNPNLPDNLISNLVKKGQTDKVKTLYNSIDDDAKGAIQSGILNKLINDATTASEGFKPQSFMKAYKAYSDPATGNTPLSVVFDGPTGQKLQTLMGIFDNLNTIGYNRINPQTGVQNLVKLDNLGKAGALAAAPFTHGASLALPIINAVKKAGFIKSLTDPKLNKLLLDIRNTNPSSQKYVDKASQLGALLAAQQ